MWWLAVSDMREDVQGNRGQDLAVNVNSVHHKYFRPAARLFRHNLTATKERDQQEPVSCLDQINAMNAGTIACSGMLAVRKVACADSLVTACQTKFVPD